MSAKDTSISFAIQSSTGTVAANGITWKRDNKTISKNSLSANISLVYDSTSRILIKKGKKILITVILKDTIECPPTNNPKLTKTLLLKLYPYGDKNIMDSVIKYINLYKDDPDFNVNTKLRLAHLVAQITTETDGFTVMTESYNYSAERIHEVFPKQFKNIDATSYAHCKCLFDKVYCCGNENLDSSSHDGSTYRGQGIIQLTWKEMYRKFTEYYQQKFNDYSVNFVTSPQLLVTNMRYSVLSALWEATHYKGGLNKYADADNGKKYSRGINIGDPGSKSMANKEKERLENLKLAKKALCL